MAQFRTVAELLEDPARWTQGANARDAGGNIVNPCSSDAVCWCLEGAIDRVYHGNLLAVASKLVLLREDLGDRAYAWNDFHYRTHAEVLALAKRLGI